MPKFGLKVPQLRCDSHTSFKVKQSRSGLQTGGAYRDHKTDEARLGEFTVMIPEPHATLQGAVTWRNQCHDRATLQGVRIPSATLKNRFSPYFMFFFVF